MLANNASGARALRYGYSRDHVRSLRVVLDSGEAVSAEQVAQPFEADGPGRLPEIVRATSRLIDQHAGLIREHRPQTPFNRCGYLLHDVLSGSHLDVARLLVGTEGTLAIFTEATLRTVPLPAGRGLVLLGCVSMDAALAAARVCLTTGPSACELIDHRLLTLARGSQPEVSALVPAGVDVVLLVEYESDSPTVAPRQAAELAARLTNGERLAMHAVTADTRAEMDRLWKVREAAMPALYGLRGSLRPVAFIEDVAVPVDALAGYLRKVQEVLQQHEVTASFLVHAGTGQVHTRPFLDLHDPADISRLFAVAEAVHGMALDLGGTVSTQHGTGLARTPWVARQYGPLYPVMRELKTIWDPKRLFNPGKIIGPSADMPAWPLRRQPAADVEPTVLQWRPGAVHDELRSCMGCGACRTTAPGQRMCPVFRTTHTEAATPRAKANLMRHLLQEAANGRSLASDSTREIADLCVNCKMCSTECPAAVNVPKLMLEAKAANVAEHGLSRGAWGQARMETLAAVGSALAPLVNRALARGPFRWLLEKLLGISRRRRLPAFAHQSFLETADRRGWTQRRRTGRPAVVYFVDVFANYNDPAIAEAAVAVLHYQGFDVYVPPDQTGCGMAPLAQGDVETAREVARQNLRQLAESAREGLPIICSEPTAALMLRRDYLDLLDDPDARVVAEQTVELTTFLGELHRQGRLRTDLARLDLSVGHHVPCHLKALGPPPAGPGLLGLIPGLRVSTIDVSCSGMAGTFGLQADNYEASLAAGRPMLESLARPWLLFGSTECSACRMQMEDAGGKHTLHPVQYLALAYGLMPNLARRLQEPLGKHLLS